MMIPTQEALRPFFDRGLTRGLGTVGGQMCIEAAIALACGEPLSDSPTCVAEPDRTFSMKLNDSPWPSSQARAEALWPLALAQLGTAGTNRTKWAQSVTLGTIQKVLPIALRLRGLDKSALACERAKNLKEAAKAARAAAKAARAVGADTAAGAAGVAALAAAGAAADDVAWGAVVCAVESANAAAYVKGLTRLKILWMAVRVALDAYEAESKVTHPDSPTS